MISYKLYLFNIAYLYVSIFLNNARICLNPIPYYYNVIER